LHLGPDELAAWASDLEVRRATLAHRDRRAGQRRIRRLASAVRRRITGERTRAMRLQADADVAHLTSQVQQLQHDGDTAAAERLILDRRRRWPARIDLIILHAELAMAAGDWDRAVERWTRLIELFGDGAPEEAQARLVTALRCRGDLEEAVRVLAAAGAPRTSSGRIAFGFEQAANSMALDDVAAAEREWRRLLGDPDLPRTLLPVVREALTSTQRSAGRTPDEDLHPERLLAVDHAEYGAVVPPVLERRSDDPVHSPHHAPDLPRCVVVVVDATDPDASRTCDGLLAWRDPTVQVIGLRPGASATELDEAWRSATGELLMLVEEGSVIDRAAFDAARALLAADAGLDLVSADEDSIGGSGERSAPLLRSAFDPELLLTQPTLGHAVVLRAAAVEAAGGIVELPVLPEDPQHLLLLRIWDLALRVSLLGRDASPGSSRVGRHLAEVLVHRPASDASTDWTVGPAWSGETAAAVALVRARLEGSEVRRSVSAAPWGVPLHVRPTSSARRVRVSVVIPTRDRAAMLAECVDGLMTRTSLGGPDDAMSAELEVVLVDNDSGEPDALALLSRLSEDERVRVVPGPGEFNFSRLVNAGVAAATGEVCVLLNNDVTVLHEDWLLELVAHAVRPDVGAVGALLEHADGRVQHAGVLVGVNGTAEHAFREWPLDSAGYLALLRSTRQVSAVTAACLAIRREVYLRIGGLDERYLPVELNDVDLCLRVHEQGLRVVWTPFARLAHHEGGTRGRGDRAGALVDGAAVRRREAQRSAFSARWGQQLDGDAFYSPRLAISGATYLLRR
jgi:GT2 family glycosyltransferase